MFHITDWSKERGITKRLPEFEERELDQVLRHFYAEARSKDGSTYSRSSLLAIRNAIERYLVSPPFNRSIKISRGEAFQLSNKMLNSEIKVQKKDCKENVQHKPVIAPGDLKQLFASKVLHASTPLGLLRNVWFNTTLYWCRRGREGQRNLNFNSFVFEVDDAGQEYARMNVDEATKNHPGGINDVQSSKKEGRMYHTSVDVDLDGLACLKKYIAKRNPKCEAFFQYPKRSPVVESDESWFENRPLGINKLGSMMKDISKAAGLSKIYTNHCVRATAITLWSNAQVPSRHIMNISGHRNEDSIKHYNTRPSADQLRTCSNVLSEACSTANNRESNHQEVADYRSDVVPAVRNQTVAVAVLDRSSQQNSVNTVLGSGGVFNSCQIHTVNVYIKKD